MGKHSNGSPLPRPIPLQPKAPSPGKHEGKDSDQGKSGKG